MDHCIQQNICTKVDQVELLVKLHKRWEELDALLKGSPAAAAKPKTKKGETGGKKADDTIDLAKKLASTGGPLNPSQSHQVHAVTTQYTVFNCITLSIFRGKKIYHGFCTAEIYYLVGYSHRTTLIFSKTLKI